MWPRLWYCGHMAARKWRKFRAEEELWGPFIDACDARDASDTLRKFIAWYTRQPGAKLPQRPTTNEVTTT